METTFVALAIFFGTVVCMILRPWDINEAVPALIGALLISFTGIMNLDDVANILKIVSNASITIISTLLMASLLESIGFFKQTANMLINRSNGDGRKLFLLTLFFSFIMTVLFNNDGSILICTPIIIQMTKMLDFDFKKAFPFLIGSALVATASSAPIGASNIANLVAMKIVGMDLNSQIKSIFIPALVGILTICGLLYQLFKNIIPEKCTIKAQNQKLPHPPLHLPPHPPRPINKPHPPFPHHQPLHPHKHKPSLDAKHGEIVNNKDAKVFKLGLVIVVLVRICFFVADYYHVPISIVSAIGTLIVAFIVSRKQMNNIFNSLKNAPWHIFLFAFGMYFIIYALKKLGIFDTLAVYMQIMIGQSLFKTIFINGIFATTLSSLLNNHPTIMLNTSIITQIGLSPVGLKAAYNATILGSDIGSLITPIGTLASLIWFHIVNKTSNFKITWAHYTKVSLLVIPPSLLASLMTLYFWTLIIY